MNELALTYRDFASREATSIESICRALVLHNRDKIQIKKEDRAVQNMVRIVRAVISLSQKKGFQGMSLRDLSQETDLSMGALYNYFNSKEELFEMIYNEGKTTILQILETHATDENPAIRPQQAICAHLYLSETLPRIFSFFFMEAKNLSPKNQKNVITMEQSSERYFEKILLDGIKKGIFQIESHQLMAGALKALLQDWYLKRYKFSSRKISVEQYAQFVIQFVETNLYAPGNR